MERPVCRLTRMPGGHWRAWDRVAKVKTYSDRKEIAKRMLENKTGKIYDEETRIS